MIRISQIFGIICSLFTIGIAPFLVYAPNGLFIFLQQFTGFIAIPIVCLVLIGLFAKHIHVPGVAAKITIIGHIIAYYLLVFQFNDLVKIHWMHVYGILFCIELAILVIWGIVAPAPAAAYSEKRVAIIDMHAWHYAILTSCILLSCATLIYVVFSKVGLAYADDVVSPDFWTYFLGTTAICAVICIIMHLKVQPIYEKYINEHYHSKVAAKLEEK